MGVDNRFRGKLFGGFNRQDVVNYIERSAQMSNEFKTGSEVLEVKCEELTRQLEDANALSLTLTETNGRFGEEIAGLNVRIDALEAEREALRQTLDLRAQEIATLKQYIAKTDETLGVFESTKERLALLELNASRRAVSIEKAAEEKAAEISNKCGDLIDALKDEYEKICNDTESTTAHIRGEMDRLGRRLTDITELLAAKAETLTQLETILSRGMED